MALSMYSINLCGGRRRRQKRIDDVGSVASAALLSFSSFVKVDTEDLSLAHIHSRGNEDVLRQKDKKQRERWGKRFSKNKCVILDFWGMEINPDISFT